MNFYIELSWMGWHFYLENDSWNDIVLIPIFYPVMHKNNTNQGIIYSFSINFELLRIKAWLLYNDIHKKRIKPYLCYKIIKKES